MTSEPTSAAPLSAPVQIEHDAFCPECNYNLRGLAEGRCPECGREFDLASLTVSQIPWSARQQIGRFRAYWRTVWFVIARAGRFSEETVRPVDYADAQRFRWLAIAHVLIFAVALTGLGFLLGPGALLMSEFFDWLFASIWMLTTVHVALLLLLAAATGVPSYFFHPKQMSIGVQNRSIALSYYACAPLALMPVVMILLIVSLQLGINLDLFDNGPVLLRIATNALLVIAITLAVILLMLWWRALVLLARRVSLGHQGRVVTLAVGLPVIWLAFVVIVFGGVLLIGTYVGLVFASVS